MIQHDKPNTLSRKKVVFILSSEELSEVSSTYVGFFSHLQYHRIHHFPSLSIANIWENLNSDLISRDLLDDAEILNGNCLLELYISDLIADSFNSVRKLPLQKQEGETRPPSL